MIPGTDSRHRSVRRRDPGGVVVLLQGDHEIASWRLDLRGRLDLGTVDELARLQLAAAHFGCAIRLRDACPTLAGLLDLAGLAEVVPAMDERGSDGCVRDRPEVKPPRGEAAPRAPEDSERRQRPRDEVAPPRSERADD
jgi:hypothetical protein